MKWDGPCPTTLNLDPSPSENLKGWRNCFPSELWSEMGSGTWAGGESCSGSCADPSLGCSALRPAAHWVFRCCKTRQDKPLGKLAYSIKWWFGLRFGVCWPSPAQGIQGKSQVHCSAACDTLIRSRSSGRFVCCFHTYCLLTGTFAQGKTTSVCFI